LPTSNAFSGWGGSDPEDRTQTTTDALCSTVDLAATILDRAGLETFNGNQGHSFLATTKSQNGHRDEALIEYNDGGKRLGFAEPARVRSIVTSDWRLTIYRDQDWGELYDLKNDIAETHNLWDSADHQDTRAHLTNRLAHHLMAQMDESPQADRLA
jgi:arylsulfatase A-like enzyme